MTARDILPLTNDLAELASQMLTDGVRDGNQAKIRRAVSTAYYALFHRLCEMCADALIGRGKSPDAYVAIYRLLDDGPARKALVEGKGSDKDLSRVADAFLELQDGRHWAVMTHRRDEEATAPAVSRRKRPSS